MGITYTKKQDEAMDLLAKKELAHCLLVGGSRSGKTFLLCHCVFARAFREPGSHHVIFRKTFKSAKTSLSRFEILSPCSL